MIRLRVIAISLVLLIAGNTSAQYTRQLKPWPVSAYGEPLDVPFWGGLNNPKPSLVDFNGDGLLDLMIGDTEGRLGYFRNEGTLALPQFVPVVERLGGIDIATWHLLVDIDDDADLDLFCDSRAGATAFYRNDGGTDSLPIFILIDSAYADFETGSNNTPAFADLDHDGDLDYFFGSPSGALEFHRNTGTPSTPSFSLTDPYYDSILAFPGGGKTSAEPQHGFSSIYFVDLDDDNDLDLFYGDVFNTNMYYFENNGDSVTSDLTWVTETYLLDPTKGFNHPRLADLDNDGDFDMIIGIANAADLDNLHLLRNLGSPDQPFFQPETENLITMIDAGSYSQPALGDIDGDGDLDLLIGNGDGRIRHFRNTGSKVLPVYELITDSLANIDIGLNAAPELVDWDSDGDLDLLIGTYQGRIQYWTNTGSATVFQPVLTQTLLGGIDVDQNAVPRTADLDGDGLLDLLVGEWDFNQFANVRLYENTGSPGSPSLTLVTTTVLPLEIRDYTVPEVFDWNNDGILDIILGGRASGLTVFAGSYSTGAFPDSLTLAKLTDSVPGSDAGTYLAIRLRDMDGDLDADAIIGEENGGLSYYEKDGSCCVGIRGNVNFDPLHNVNVADLTALINFLFKGGTAPVCRLEANINGDPAENVNVADLTVLVSYLFRGGSAPPVCP